MDPVRRAGRSALARELERSLDRAGMARHGRALVAVSGGVDSTALLLLTAAVARRRGWTIEAATVDHHLRAGAAEDAAHACAFASSIGVECRCLEVHPGAGPGSPSRARRERYAALAALAQERGLPFVLTGHHAHDQLETMLLAMLRGSGVRAAGGMPLRRRLAAGVHLVRPLLEVSRPALERLCRRLGLEWREDPTNASEHAPRSVLRHRLIPVLESLRPGVARRASHLAMLMREAGRRLERDARTQVPATTTSLGRAALRRWPRALRCGVLRRLLDVNGAPATAARVREIDAAVMDGRRHQRQWSLGEDQTLELVADALRLTGRCSAADRPTRRR